MSINIGDHSLVFLLGAQAITDELQNLESQFGELIEFTEENTGAEPVDSDGYQPFVITYTAINKSLPFYFEVRAVKDTGRGTVVYAVARKPSIATNVSAQSINGELASVLTWFRQWANLVEQYNTVRLSRKDRFIQQAAAEVYTGFELVDEDADTAPFDNDKQVLVYKWLESVKEKVAQVEDGDQEQAQHIIQEITQLQNIIPTITKAALLKEVSKVYAKAKAFSMKLFVDIYDVAKKELIKAALKGGLHEADLFIQHL